MDDSFLTFKYLELRLDFKLSKNKDIYFIYAGLDKNKTIIKNNEQNFAKVVQAEYTNGINNTNRGLKLNETSYGNNHKYVTHSFKNNKLGKELIITTKNQILRIDTHFQFYKGTKSISTYNVVKNISHNDITLTFISSFYLLGIVPSNQKNNYLYRATNSWHTEAQWSKFNFLDLGIYNGNNHTSMNRFTINNTGGWSTKEHLPMLVVENDNNSTLVQIENNGSWHLEVGDYANYVYLLASGPEFNDNQWKKIIAPKETFKSVQATLSYGGDFEEVIQEITKARRLMRRDAEDLKHLPVIFNDYMHALWDTQTRDLILPLVDLAAELGCEEFCMDAGWFAKGNQWWSILGQWEEYKENFPNGGLKAVCDYIRLKKMKVGLWIEIETVGINSPILKKMKDGYFFKVGGVNSVNNRRYQLNFANKDVYKYALKVIDNLMNKYQLDYLKIDYNVDCGVGNEYNSDSLGDGLLKHNRAYIKWLNEVMNKYPHLTIENCGSGGCRMDYEILKYCPIQSTSDQTNYRKYPYLSTNVFTACPPEQAAVWSYPLNDYEKTIPTDEVVIMNMCNAMLGRIHLASFINKLPESQKALIKEGIKYYHSIISLKKRSLPVYPKGTAKFFDNEVVGGIMDEKKIILGVWNTSGNPNTVKVDLTKYHVSKIKIGYPTSRATKFTYNQKTKILEVTFKEAYGGRILELTKSN
ncbi:MAG: alpha-galactosidase [Bacilli bacterium]|nr:alpha-galactosidase [Bacilli bacterium]